MTNFLSQLLVDHLKGLLVEFASSQFGAGGPCLFFFAEYLFIL